MKSPHTDKAEIRKRMLALRRAYAPEKARAASLAAQQKMLDLPIFKKAAQIALYMPIRGEIGTDLLLREAWKDKKTILLPRVHKTEKGMFHFAPCLGPEDLAPGVFNILEPGPSVPDLDWNDERLRPELVIVPALAFEPRGFRLGYGGGYYDRALARPALAAAVSAGFMYSFQLLASLPIDEYDRRLDCLCSEEKIIWT